MANLQSAKKRLRQSVKHQLRNKVQKSRIKTAEKKLRRQLQENIPNESECKVTLSQLSSLCDKAAKTGAIHTNKANRKKSRLASLLVQSQKA